MLKSEFLRGIKLLNNRITDEVIVASHSNKTSFAYWQRRQRIIQRLYDRMLKLWQDFVLSSYAEIYQKERWKQIMEAKRQIPRIKKLYFRKRVDKEDIQEYLKSFLNDMNTAVDYGMREKRYLLRLLKVDKERSKAEKQVKEVEAFLTPDEIETLILEAESYPAARKKIIEELLNNSEDGVSVVVPTTRAVRDGVLHYKATYYANMLMRTTVRQLQTNAVLDAAKEVDTDLVQVSVHNTMCPICMPYEGKIYSVEGKSSDFPPLEDAPPYHPNCLHSLTVTFRSTLERLGIQKYIDFSQGTSEIHPTVRNWIPLSERVSA